MVLESPEPAMSPRRGRRVHLNAPIIVQQGTTRQELLTEDFSTGGIYVRASNFLPAPRSFVRMTVPLSGFGRGFILTGMVVHKPRTSKSSRRCSWFWHPVFCQQ